MPPPYLVILTAPSLHGLVRPQAAVHWAVKAHSAGSCCITGSEALGPFPAPPKSLPYGLGSFLLVNARCCCIIMLRSAHTFLFCPQAQEIYPIQKVSPTGSRQSECCSSTIGPAHLAAPAKHWMLQLLHGHLQQIAAFAVSLSIFCLLFSLRASC